MSDDDDDDWQKLKAIMDKPPTSFGWQHMMGTRRAAGKEQSARASQRPAHQRRGSFRIPLPGKERKGVFSKRSGHILKERLSLTDCIFSKQNLVPDPYLYRL